MRFLATFCLSAFVLTLLVQPVAADAPTLAVFVHPSNPVTALSGPELESIFTSSRRHWPGGKNIAAFNYPPREPLRTAFDLAVLRMTPDEVGRFWINQRIRGRPGPPRTVPTTSLMLRVVESLPTAIGYAPIEQVKDRAVKIIARVEGSKVLAP